MFNIEIIKSFTYCGTDYTVFQEKFFQLFTEKREQMLFPTPSREAGHHQVEVTSALLERTRTGYYVDKGNKTSEKMKPFLEVTRNICVSLTMSFLSILQKQS